MASPIAWEHHYGITLPLFALVLPSALHEKNRIIVVLVSYVLVATFVASANLLADTWLNICQSTLFAGAVLLLWLLAKEKGRPLWASLTQSAVAGDKAKIV